MSDAYINPKTGQGYTKVSHELADLAYAYDQCRAMAPDFEIKCQYILIGPDREGRPVFFYRIQWHCTHEGDEFGCAVDIPHDSVKKYNAAPPEFGWLLYTQELMLLLKQASMSLVRVRTKISDGYF